MKTSPMRFARVVIQRMPALLQVVQINHLDKVFGRIKADLRDVHLFENIARVPAKWALNG